MVRESWKCRMDIGDRRRGKARDEKIESVARVMSRKVNVLMEIK